MTDWEFYWDLVSRLSGIGVTLIRAYLLCYFVKPFLQKSRYIVWAGISYAVVMLVMEFYPDVINVMTAYAAGATAAFLVVYFIDRRNVAQKIFLAVTFYLLKWITWGIILVPWRILYQLLILSVGMRKRYFLQFGLYVIMEMIYLVMNYFGMLLCIRVIHREYNYKKENMTKRELSLMLAPLFSIIAGYGIFQFAVHAYEKDTMQYIWNGYAEYEWILAVYMALSFVAMLTVIISYQRIKSSQRQEKENAVLSGQIEDMKRHISEVEKLYHDIRSLKHDMGNHVMTMEKLCGKSKEAGKYIAQLKEQVRETAPEMKSGNPITDVILQEKQEEACEKGIAFESRFYFPESTVLSAFDVSVVLNNALNNAIEAAVKCENPYIFVSSYRRKNACMIEVRNSAAEKRSIDEESGLPLTTKEGAEHGFGLANIRKVARKYYGDIAIEQEEGVFKLVVMLMVG